MQEQEQKSNILKKTKQLLRQLNLTEIVVQITFNDGSCIDYASHIELEQDLKERKIDFNLIEQLLAKEKESKEAEIINENLKNDCQKPTPVLAIQRRHGECAFSFIGFSLSGYKSFIDATKSIKNVEKKFEIACIAFIDEILADIFNSYPESKYSFVLADKKLRDAVIRETFEEKVKLSPREQECLWECGQGKSVKEAARVLKISPTTVRRHLESIREVFEVDNLPQIFIECVHRGILGKYNIFHAG